MDIKIITGGVTAPQGFKASGLHAGIRRNKTKKDVALILADSLCNAAAVYTANIVKSAPIYVTKRNLSNGKAQAIICNSGNANACALGGEEAAERMALAVARQTGIDAGDVIVASTGVIGVPLDPTPIENIMPQLAASLGDNSEDANLAIMTTDTRTKSIAVEFVLGDKICRMGGIAKGSGMIHPNMATMLVFVTTDVAISSDLLLQAIQEDVKDSFNMVSVDGDTSTNDMLAVMASGRANNDEIKSQNEDFIAFKEALKTVTVYLCREIARDGEGAGKLVECVVCGAQDQASAKKAAKSIVTSNLFKAAMFGADANWGRVMCALGYSGITADVSKARVSFESRAGKIVVCSNGCGIDFDEDEAKKILCEDEIKVEVSLADGEGFATAWGCDLTYDYVRINGDYRT